MLRLQWLTYLLRIRVLLGLLRYMLARGMDLWRRGASIREYGNENVELPLLYYQLVILNSLLSGATNGHCRRSKEVAGR